MVWTGEQLRLLDQRALPHEVTYIEVDDIEAAYEAIATLAVRGAPAIGIAAAYALAVSMRDAESGRERFRAELADNAARLTAARPTAVNLAWACNRLIDAAGIDPSFPALLAQAEAIEREDRAACAAIGRHGAPLISPESGVLTHCNAGALAVSALGTATAPMYTAHRAGVAFHVYVDETRPLLQGARLTAWELSTAGIDATLICDNAAASLFAAGKVDLVLVGTDRVAANGDVANKIGTLNLAVLCKHFDVPFYVACPASTFDPHTANGASIEIEHRSPRRGAG